MNGLRDVFIVILWTDFYAFCRVIWVKQGKSAVFRRSSYGDCTAKHGHRTVTFGKLKRCQAVEIYFCGVMVSGRLDPDTRRVDSKKNPHRSGDLLFRIKIGL